MDPSLLLSFAGLVGGACVTAVGVRSLLRNPKVEAKIAGAPAKADVVETTPIEVLRKLEDALQGGEGKP